MSSPLSKRGLTKYNEYLPQIRDINSTYWLTVVYRNLSVEHVFLPGFDEFKIHVSRKT
jgi:hypothetical protein